MQARCSCHQVSPTGDWGDVEAWTYKHHQQIEQVRAHLGSRSPSLKTQLTWFEAQAANTENPVGDRELWRQLADETGRYLTQKPAGPMPGELPLF